MDDNKAKVIEERQLLREILLRKYGPQPMENLLFYKTTKARHHQEKNGFICTLLLPNIYPDQDFQGKRSASKREAERSAAAECLKFMVDEVELTTNLSYDWKTHLSILLTKNLNDNEAACRENMVYQSVKLEESSAVIFLSSMIFPQLLPGVEFFGDLSRSKKQAEQSVAQRVGADSQVMSEILMACRELALTIPFGGFEQPEQEKRGPKEMGKLKRWEKYKAICKLRAEKSRQKALPKHLRDNATAAPAEPEVLTAEGQAKYRFKEAHLQWRDLVVTNKVPSKSQLFAYHSALQRNLLLSFPRGFGKTFVMGMVMHRLWLSTGFALNSLPRLAAAPKHSTQPAVPSAVLVRNPSFAVMVVNQVSLVYQQRDKLALDTGLRVFAVGSLAEFTALPEKIRQVEFEFLVITTGFLLQTLHRTILSPLQLRDVCCLVFYECTHDPFVESIMQIVLVSNWKPRLYGVTAHPVFVPSHVKTAAEIEEAKVLGTVQKLTTMLLGATLYMPSLPPLLVPVENIVCGTPLDSTASAGTPAVEPSECDEEEDDGDMDAKVEDFTGLPLGKPPPPPLPHSPLQNEVAIPPPPPPVPAGPPPVLKRIKEVSLLHTLDGYSSDNSEEGDDVIHEQQVAALMTDAGTSNDQKNAQDVLGENQTVETETETETEMQPTLAPLSSATGFRPPPPPGPPPPPQPTRPLVPLAVNAQGIQLYFDDKQKSLVPVPALAIPPRCDVDIQPASRVVPIVPSAAMDIVEETDPKDTELAFKLQLAALIALLQEQDNTEQGNVLVYTESPDTAQRVHAEICAQLGSVACTVLLGHYETSHPLKKTSTLHFATAETSEKEEQFGDIDIDSPTAEEVAAVEAARYTAAANLAAARSMRKRVLQERADRSTKVVKLSHHDDKATNNSANGDSRSFSNSEGKYNGAEEAAETDADDGEDEVVNEVESSVANALSLEDLEPQMDEDFVLNLSGHSDNGPKEETGEDAEPEEDAICPLESVFETLSLPLDALWGTKVVICTTQALTDGALLQNASGVKLALVTRFSGDLSFLRTVQDRCGVKKDTLFQRAQYARYTAIVTQEELHAEGLQRELDGMVRRLFHA